MFTIDIRYIYKIFWRTVFAWKYSELHSQDIGRLTISERLKQSCSFFFCDKAFLHEKILSFGIYKIELMCYNVFAGCEIFA